MSDGCWREIQTDNLGSQLTPEKNLLTLTMPSVWDLMSYSGQNTGTVTDSLIYTLSSQRSNQGGFSLWPSGICIQLCFWRCVQCEIIPRQTALVFQLLNTNVNSIQEKLTKIPYDKILASIHWQWPGRQPLLLMVVNDDNFWVRLSIFLTGSDAFGLWWHFPRIATGSMRW